MRGVEWGRAVCGRAGTTAEGLVVYLLGGFDMVFILDDVLREGGRGWSQ